MNNAIVNTDAFFQEYTSPDAVLKYSKATAGFGINYLLENDYKSVYCEALEHLPEDAKRRGIRVLEFGCGAGMNLIHLVSLLKEKGIRLERAIGTDFSPVLIDVARREAKHELPAEELHKVDFCNAKNESLVPDLASVMGDESLKNCFHLVFGVNTFRYCHRNKNSTACARDIMELLAPHGVCVIIDMNQAFPAFRSALKNHFRFHKKEECYIPSLDEYAEPFEKTGFNLLRRENFCWVPHSGGRLMCGTMTVMAPMLNLIAKSRAMRSLVVVQKP
jgi:SAM-dependent methyltransferase